MKILDGELYRAGRKYPLPSRREAFWLPLVMTAGSVGFWAAIVVAVGRAFRAW